MNLAQNTFDSKSGPKDGGSPKDHMELEDLMNTLLLLSGVLRSVRSSCCRYFEQLWQV